MSCYRYNGGRRSFCQHKVLRTAPRRHARVYIPGSAQVQYPPCGGVAVSVDAEEIHAVRQYARMPVPESSLQKTLLPSYGWLEAVAQTNRNRPGEHMYLLNVTAHFSAAHRLEGYNGACRNLHGHNWKVRGALPAAPPTTSAGRGLQAHQGELQRPAGRVRPHHAERPAVLCRLQPHLREHRPHRVCRDAQAIRPPRFRSGRNRGGESDSSSVIYREN
jgi:hypothetical protein